MIYFAKANNKIKIGWTERPLKRLKELQTANHDKFIFLYFIENVPKSFESFLHEICKRYHIRGEWFNIKVIQHLLKHPWYKEHLKKFI